MGTKVKDLTVESAPVLTDYTINERVGGAGVQPKKTLWQTIFNLFVSAGMAAGTYAKNITATGTNQATAATLSNAINRIDTVGAGTGVVNAALEAAGFDRIVQNNGANDLVYYPFLGSNFFVIGVGAMATNAGITIAPGNQVRVKAYASGELTFI